MADDEQNERLDAEETAAVESPAAAPADASAESVDPTAAVEPTPAETEAGESAASSEAEPATEAEAAKPKRSRTAKPKAEKADERKPAAKQPEPKKSEPKSAPKRGAGEQPVAAPVVRAQAKYVRSSARKARLVCDNIRGKSVDDARAILAHTPRAVARDWSKLLESAVANAEHNHELVGEDLVVKAIHADEGPTIKRFRPRAQGRATRIRKRTSHLTILLTPKN